MSISIQINEYLFMAYIGLTASGYDLADKDNAKLQELITEIHALPISDDISGYFKLARSSNTINPYWPNGSAISAACFFIKDFAYKTFDDFVAFIKSTGFDGFDDAFWPWIWHLPEHLVSISEYMGYPKLFSAYSNFIQSRMPEFQIQIDHVAACIERFASESYDIVFSPNLLQLDGMADYVKRGGTTTIITTFPESVAILHEFMHPFISKHERKIRSYLPGIDFSKCIDTEKMKAYGYMWDNSENAKVHALEECFVRGISIGISNASAEEKVQRCKWSSASGFILVDEVAARADINKVTDATLGEFITNVLRSLRK
jgi:hypothetical protein